MIKHVVIVFNIFLTITCLSQVDYESGYFINNNDQKIECLIKNYGWKNNPTKLEFKTSMDSKPDTMSIWTVKEFEIYNVSKYISRDVEIDKSSSKPNKLSDVASPIFKKERLFLQVLVEGKANLYLYRGKGSLTRYFYKVEGTQIQQLVYKKYKTVNNSIKKNNQFRQQLIEHLQCSPSSIENALKLNYSKKKLLNFFTEFNECSNSTSVFYASNKKKNLFNLSIRPRINSSTLNILNYNNLGTHVESKINFGLGLEIEYILPYYRNKWSIFLEPTYKRFITEKTTDITYLIERRLVSNIKYNSIEVPFGFRHYLFLNKDSKIFINASFVTDFSFNSNVEFKTNNSSTAGNLDLITRWNWAIGLGYKLQDKLIIEMRYQTNRQLLANSQYTSLKHSSISLIFGYTIF